MYTTKSGGGECNSRPVIKDTFSKYLTDGEDLIVPIIILYNCVKLHYTLPVGLVPVKRSSPELDLLQLPGAGLVKQIALLEDLLAGR